MDIELVKEVIECFPKERTVYRYYKDGYAISLLERYLQKNGPQKISNLRKSELGKLLNRPIFEYSLGQLGNGLVTHDALTLATPIQQESYILTLGVWGHKRASDWEQVSRRGANLVLQVNFNSQHDKSYKRYVSSDFDAFKYIEHPISKSRSTMAWARIDLDFEKNEALIEEIQTDWLRYLASCSRRREVAIRRSKSTFRYAGIEISVDKITPYLKEMEKHRMIWSEAVLNAAINFVFDELGLSRLFFHSFETGAVLKGIRWGKPPKSLYTDLPRKFCFEKVDEGPEFICKDKRAMRRLKAIKKPQWFAMGA